MFPHQLDVLEDETSEFPFPFTKLGRSKVSLCQFADGNVLNDCYSKLAVEKQNDQYVLRVNGLPAGEYELNFKKQLQKVTITVHRGQYWENNNFILKKDCLFENKEK